MFRFRCYIRSKSKVKDNFKKSVYAYILILFCTIASRCCLPAIRATANSVLNLHTPVLFMRKAYSKKTSLPPAPLAQIA